MAKTSLTLTSELPETPTAGEGIKLGGKWFRSHLHKDGKDRIVKMPSGWLKSILPKLERAIRADQRSNLPSGDSRVLKGDPPLMLYKWANQDQGFLGIRDLTKEFRIEMSPGGVFGIAPSQVYFEHLPKELRGPLMACLDKARVHDFSFDRLPARLNKSDFVKALKAGKIQKINKDWLPTHKMSLGGSEQMSTGQASTINDRLLGWLQEEVKQPVKNGGNEPLSDGSLCYKWMDDSSHRVGLVGVKPAKAAYRIETDGARVYVLHHEKLYETEAHEQVKKLVAQSLRTTKNPYKQGKTGKAVASGQAEMGLLMSKPGSKWMVGLDESGRSNLVGPLVAAAVLADAHTLHEVFSTVQDSKGMEVDQRYLLSEKLKETIPYGIGRVEVSELNHMNLNDANKLAFERALDDLQERNPAAQIDVILVDGSSIKLDDPRACYYNRGEQSSVTIAAASVLAAEDFEQALEDLDEKYPGYDFSKTKAQSANAQHTAAMNELGLTPEHRLRFKPVQRVLAAQEGITR